jgi:hypothetical protein
MKKWFRVLSIGLALSASLLQAQETEPAATVAAEEGEPAIEPSSAGPKPFVYSSVPGSKTLSSVLGSEPAGAAGGAVMGADMLQTNMRMNLQLMNLQHAVQTASRYAAIRQEARCLKQARGFKINGIGFGVDEWELARRLPHARPDGALSDAALGRKVYSLDKAGKVDRLTFHFLRGKMVRMTAEWHAAGQAASFEDIKKKLSIRLGPDDSKVKVDLSLGAPAAEAAPAGVSVWDFTDLAVDRVFELSQAAGTRDVVLHVSAPSRSIDVGF